MKNRSFLFLGLIVVIPILSSLVASAPTDAYPALHGTITPTIFGYLPSVAKNWPPTPTPTATFILTATPTSGPGMTLYLCEYTWDGQHWRGKLAATSCPTAGANIVAGLVDVRFDTTLTGDIDGTSYGVNIALATMPNGASPSVDVSIILNHGGHETILASTTFIVTNYSGENPPFNYQFYTASVAGLDPDSSVGDRLILSIMNNGPGTMVLGHGFFQSKIVIPQVR